MTTPINPILVVRDNLPEYRDELIHERATLQQRVLKIDEDVALLDRLAQAIKPSGEIKPWTGPAEMDVTDGE